MQRSAELGVVLVVGAGGGLEGGLVGQAAAQEPRQHRLDLNQVVLVGGGAARPTRRRQPGSRPAPRRVRRAVVGQEVLVVLQRSGGDDGGERGEELQGGLQGGVELAVAVLHGLPDQPGRVRGRPAGLQLGEHRAAAAGQDGQDHGQRQRVPAQQGDQVLQRVPLRFVFEVGGGG